MELKQLTAKDIYPDSIEVGTPAKGGVFKVYFDASKPDETKIRIDNAAKALAYANEVRGNVEVIKDGKSNE